MESISERRQSQRILFEKHDHIMGYFSLPVKQGKSIVVQILNMSSGGIFFSLRSNRDVQLKMGDKIIFEDIVNKDSKTFSLKMNAIVIWIMDDPTMEFAGIGSKFLDMDPEKEIKINDCIQHCQLTGDET
ncbi:MAG: PilZ domain-containing protein [Calditrichia bacterium]|nr:PilZ domain-containing protein [Calditrichia bacterium]